MQMNGIQLAEALLYTTSMVKVLSMDGIIQGRLTADQARSLALAGGWLGAGSSTRVRYIRPLPAIAKTPKQLLLEETFCEYHGLARYDPTYFRSFAGFVSDMTASRGKLLEKTVTLTRGEQDDE